jgi:hypothetical protein
MGRLCANAQCKISATVSTPADESSFLLEALLSGSVILGNGLVSSLVAKLTRCSRGALRDTVKRSQAYLH